MSDSSATIVAGGNTLRVASASIKSGDGDVMVTSSKTAVFELFSAVGLAPAVAPPLQKSPETVLGQ
jgi:hypothetical protein